MDQTIRITHSNNKVQFTRPRLAPPYDLDRAIHAQFAHLTLGLSPASIYDAYLDWFAHLAISPGKQQELMSKAVNKSIHIGLQTLQSGIISSEPCIAPLPQDRRFKAPEWQQWPFNLIYQSFLLNQQWWHNATTDVRGVTNQHEQMVTFATRQILDMFSPSNFFFTNPEVLAATVASGGANLVQGAQNQQQDTLRLATGQPPAGSEKFHPGVDVAITPGKVVFRNHLIELIQYQPQTATVFAEPILIVPPWIMKFYILDLSPGDSLVKYLVERGYTVFIVSWLNPSSIDRDLGMDDYLKDGVMTAIDAVTTIVPAKKIQALGYCLGGTLLAIAASFMARSNDNRLNTLTMLTSEVDFTEPGELGMFIDSGQLDYLDSLMSEKGFLEGTQMTGSFALLNSRDMLWSRMVHEYMMGLSQKASDLSAWNADSTRMPYRQHSEYLHRLYLHNDLAQGRYLVEGKPVALPDIRVPIFSLGTQRDTVAPWRSVYKINLLTHTDVTFCLSSGGHNVGVVNPPGSGVPRSYQVATHAANDHYIDPDTWVSTSPVHEGSWWPEWEVWLRKSAGKQVALPAMGNPTGGYPVLEDAPGSYVLIL